MRTPTINKPNFRPQYDDLYFEGEKYSLDPNLNDHYFYQGISGVKRAAKQRGQKFLFLARPNGRKTILSTDPK